MSCNISPRVCGSASPKKERSTCIKAVRGDSELSLLLEADADSDPGYSTNMIEMMPAINFYWTIWFSHLPCTCICVIVNCLLNRLNWKWVGFWVFSIIWFSVRLSPWISSHSHKVSVTTKERKWDLWQPSCPLKQQLESN